MGISSKLVKENLAMRLGTTSVLSDFLIQCRKTKGTDRKCEAKRGVNSIDGLRMCKDFIGTNLVDVLIEEGEEELVVLLSSCLLVVIGLDQLFGFSPLFFPLQVGEPNMEQVHVSRAIYV